MVWLPVPVRMISLPLGVLTLLTMVKADWHSSVGRTWLVVTTVTVVLFNVLLCVTFLAADDGGGDVGLGFAITGAISVASLTAVALILSYLGSLLRSHLDIPSRTSTIDDNP